MPLRSLQRLVWLHLVMPPKWQVTGRQCWTPGGHHESLPGLAEERKRLGLLWEMPYAQRKTQLCCVDLQILPAWILTLSFSSSQAVAGVRHHLVALEAAAAAIRCTNVRQPDRVRYESRAPRFAIGVYSLPLAPTISAGWGYQECPHSPPSLVPSREHLSCGHPCWAAHGRVLWGRGLGLLSYSVGLCMDVPGLLTPYHAASQGFPWFLTNLWGNTTASSPQSHLESYSGNVLYNRN